MRPSTLAPLLPALARILADRLEVGEDALTALLLGIGQEGDAEARAELRRWHDLLALLHSYPAGGTLTAVQEALRLRGVPRATAHEAEALILGSVAGARAQRGRLIASVRALHLGMPVGDLPAYGEFQVQGGPGEVIAESFWLCTLPSRFEAGPTRIVVEADHMGEASVGWLLLRTAEAELRLPVLVRPQQPLRLGRPEIPASTLPLPPDPPPHLEPFHNQPGLDAAEQAKAVSALRGSFIREDLRAKGLIGRVGLGAIHGLDMTNDGQVLAITDQGATLFDADQSVIWQIECPATGGWLSEANDLLILRDADHISYTWSLADGMLTAVNRADPQPVDSHGPLVPAVSGPAQSLWKDAYKLREQLSSSITTDATAISPDDRYVADARSDGIVEWHVAANRCVQDLTNMFGARMVALAFNSDASALASADELGNICLYALASDDEIAAVLAAEPAAGTNHAVDIGARYCGDHQYVERVWFSDSDRALVSESEDGQMLWDAVQGTFCAWFAAAAPEETFIACSDDGSLLALGTARHVVLWAAREARTLHTLRLPSGDASFSGALANADGSCAVVTSGAGYYLWHAARPDQTTLLVDGRLGKPEAFAPDGQSILCWDMRGLRLLRIDLTGLAPSVVEDFELDGSLWRGEISSEDEGDRWAISPSQRYAAASQGWSSASGGAKSTDTDRWNRHKDTSVPPSTPQRSWAIPTRSPILRSARTSACLPQPALMAPFGCGAWTIAPAYTSSSGAGHRLPASPLRPMVPPSAGSMGLWRTSGPPRMGVSCEGWRSPRGIPAVRSSAATGVSRCPGALSHPPRTPGRCTSSGTLPNCPAFRSP